MTATTGNRTLDPQADRVLRWVAIAFAVVFVFHNADHFRRGTDSVTSELFWAGTGAGIVSIAVIVLVLLRHESAPIVAAAGGFALALAFAASHFAPQWSALSDSFVEGSPETVSVVAAALEIVGATALGCAGVYALRRRTLTAA